jgi:hypothetical protein
MGTYPNGGAPEGALVQVTGVHVAPGLAPRLIDFFAFAASVGVHLRVFDGRTAGWALACGGYCTIPEQKLRFNGGKPSGGSTIPVASAGSSTHGDYNTGRADIVGANGHSYTAAELAFVIAHIGSFGLEREFGDRDPNHVRAVGDYTPKTKTQEIDMAGWQFLTPDTIVMPSGYATSLPHDAWVALKARQDNPDSSGMDWATGWYVDLSWQSVRFIEAETAKATADAVKALLTGSGIPVKADTSEIVAGIIAGLGKPPVKFTITGEAHAE